MAPLRFVVFRFVILGFGALRRVWVLTQAFDAGLGGLTLVTAPAVASAIRSLTRSMAAWPEVSLARYRLGGRQFNCRGIELGHIHSNGVADIRLTPTEQADVLASRRAERHHTAPNSTWVTFYLERADQAESVASLFQIPFRRVTSPEPSRSESPSEEYVP